MKIIKKILITILLGLMIISPSFLTVNAKNNINIYFFHSIYCGHCQDMDAFLTGLEDDYDNINIIYYEVNQMDNYYLLKRAVNTFNKEAEVPFVVIGGLSFLGYNEQNTIDIEHTLDYYSTHDFVDVMQKVINNEEVLLSDFDTLNRDVIHLPWIGDVQIQDASLLLSAIVLGLVDGFNPCAMWVLVFLITMLINYNDRKRMWIIGGTFLAVSAILYFLIMVSWLQIAVSLTAVKWIRYVIGAFAIGFGGYHLIKYIKDRNKDVGCEVTTPTRREKLMNRIKSIVKKRNLWIALAGVIVLAVTVNLVELACSAGLPLLFTQILAYNDLGTGMYFLYIGIYVFVFLIDDIAIFVVAMITMKVTGVSNRYTKYSTVIGGIIMLILGILLIFFPNIIMFNF